MQDQRVIWKPFGRLRQFGLETGTYSIASAGEHELTVWWLRATTLTSMGYVLFSQTLHAQPGWSRLGIVFAVLLAGLLVTGRVLRIGKFRSPGFAWLTAPFLTYCLIKSVPETGNEWPVEELFPLACAFLGGISVALGLRAGVSFKAIVYAQVLSNLCNIVAAFLGIGTEAVGGDPVRYAGVTGNANDFGLQLTIGACLIWLAPRQAGWFPCSFAFFSVAYAVGTSGSRTALLVAAFFLALVSIQILGSIKTKRRIVLALSLTAAICLLGAMLAPLLLDKAKTITAIDRALDHRDSSFEKRMGMIQQALRLWQQAPVFGHGLDGFERLSGYPGYAHNNYAELLCNLGLVGVFLYYSLHLAVLLRATKLRPALRFYSWVCIAMLLVIDVGSVNYKSKQTIMVLMILVSHAAAERRRLVERAEEKSGARPWESMISREVA